MPLPRFAAALAGVVMGLGLSAAAAGTLVLGSVNDNVRKHLDRFAPLAAYLQEELAGHGIDRVEISVLPTSDAMITALGNGAVDLYFDSPLVAGRVAREAGAVPFLRRWKQGVATYHSVILVPSDSPITEIGQLRGARIGFQEPDSTSGFLLPMGLLRAENLTLRELDGHEIIPGPDEIGYVFTGDDKNSITWLVKGWVEAVATDPRGFEILENARPGQFRAIARSEDVPRQVVIRRAGMDEALVARIAEVLTTMHETDHGLEVMAKFHDTTRFDAFPDGVEATFGRIYALLDRLEDLEIF